MAKGQTRKSKATQASHGQVDARSEHANTRKAKAWQAKAKANAS